MTAKKAPSKVRQIETADSMASRQREISVSEFFAKNRHLLGFDNPRKALLTVVKEAVDNALDACEEGGILPEIKVQLLPVNENHYKITIKDNGPGILPEKIGQIFGKLLYGSKFHQLKMSRGQQGIGISAAGMYGLMTTGQPMIVISKAGKRRSAIKVELKIDTAKNKSEIISEEPLKDSSKIFPSGQGTQVTIELEGRHQKGKQSVDEYLEQTAIANPHASITYITPSNETIVFPRAIKELPPEPKEIKPHPKGIELGTLLDMLKRTESKKVGAFLQRDFCRVGSGTSKEICKKAKLDPIKSWVKSIDTKAAQNLYKAIQEVKITAPPTDCLAPIGSKNLLAGQLKEVQAEFFAASDRPPTVYRGNPFQIEVALAYGGKLPGDQTAKVLRFANRVPLLYQQSACCSFKAVVETSWKNYNMQQPRGAAPIGPLVILVHMASVWVPFTSESKEAIADYDEIRKQIRLALQECGRKLGTYLRKRTRIQKQAQRRIVFERYVGEIASACNALTNVNETKLVKALLKQAAQRTMQAGEEMENHGTAKDIDPFENDAEVVVVKHEDSSNEVSLFGEEPQKKKVKKKNRKRK